MRRLTAILAVLAVGLAACGGDDGGGGGEQGTSSEACPDGSVMIKMADIKFDPEDATADVGQDICWTNEDSIDHNAVADSGASFESELFGQGETFTTSVDRPGTVQYECTIHPGMAGTITIQR